MCTYRTFLLVVVIILQEHGGKALLTTAKPPSPPRREPLWTGWGRWSACSYRCGPGVRSRERACVGQDENGRTVRLDDHRECAGSDAVFMACNDRPCGADGQQAHSQQCSAHDNEVIYGRRFTWLPYFEGPHICTLTCLAEGTKSYYDFGHVRDGTVCEEGSANMCVRGRCLSTGCDGIVGSNAVVDHCGVCGGEDDGCVFYQNEYTNPHPPDGRFGYKKILKLPSGATHVNISEDSANYLALAYTNLTYVVNGDWTIDWPGEYSVAGTTLHYTRDDHKETFIIDGPTTEDIQIILMFRQENRGVYFEFYLPEEQLSSIEHLTKPPTTPLPTTTTTTTASTTTTTTTSQPSTTTPRPQRNTTLPPDLIKKWYEEYLESIQGGRSQSDTSYVQQSHSQTNHVTETENTVHHFPTGNQNPAVVQVRVSTKRTYGNTVSRQRTDTQQHQSDETPPVSTTPRTPDRTTRRQPGDNPFGYTRPAWCGACQPPRQLARHFCNSDFVSKIRVVDYKNVDNETRYLFDVLDNYNSNIDLFDQEYVWVTNICRCPQLRINTEYIVIGKLAEHGDREVRLEMTSDSYAKTFSAKLNRKAKALNRANSCRSRRRRY